MQHITVRVQKLAFVDLMPHDYLKQVKNGIVHDLSAHAPGVNVDPIVQGRSRQGFE